MAKDAIEGYLEAMHNHGWIVPTGSTRARGCTVGLSDKLPSVKPPELIQALDQVG